jgi:hypothetical protein
MADTHEERLLNELLGDIAAADAASPAVDLESRVMAAWDARDSKRDRGKTLPIPFHVAWVICGLAAAMVLRGSDPMTNFVIGSDPLPAPAISAPHPDLPKATALDVPEPMPLPRAEPATRRPRAPRVDPETTAFVPLVPMMPRELSGSFQIVRVQMPRASLAGLASMMRVPATRDVVEADVLLGEDGMARAIRISTNERSWRTR